LPTTRATLGRTFRTLAESPEASSGKRLPSGRKVRRCNVERRTGLTGLPAFMLLVVPGYPDEVTIPGANPNTYVGTTMNAYAICGNVTP
jgi:hypothetical protein